MPVTQYTAGRNKNVDRKCSNFRSRMKQNLYQRAKKPILQVSEGDIKACGFLKNPFTSLFYLFTKKDLCERDKSDEVSEIEESARNMLREISMEKRVALIDKAEGKLQELKKLYNESWNVFQYKSKDLDKKTLCRILRLLMKVRRKIIKTKGKISMLEKCELLDMIENLNELNEEILIVKSDCYDLKEAKASPAADTRVRHLTSMKIWEDEAQTSSQSLENTNYSTDGYTISSNDEVDSLTTACTLDMRDPINEVVLTGTESSSRLGGSKDDSFEITYDEDNTKHASLTTQTLLRNCLLKVIGVNKDLMNIKKEIIQLAEIDLTRKLKSSKVNRCINEQISDDLPDEDVQLYISPSNYEGQFHNLVRRLEEIKTAYKLLKTLPLTYVQKKYKLAEIKRLMRSLELVHRKAAAINERNNNSEMVQTNCAVKCCGGQVAADTTTKSSMITKNCNVSMIPNTTSSAGTRSKYVKGIRNYYVRKKDMTMPWDRGTNSVYQSLMYTQLKQPMDDDEAKYRDKSINCPSICFEKAKKELESCDEDQEISGIAVSNVHSNSSTDGDEIGNEHCLEVAEKIVEPLSENTVDTSQETNDVNSCVQHGGENSTDLKAVQEIIEAKKHAETSYDSFLQQSELSYPEGVPYWRTKFKKIECDSLVKDAIQKAVKGHNNAYGQAVMDTINNLNAIGMKLKSQCYNRGTSVTGISEDAEQNEESVEPKSWSKYSKTASKDQSIKQRPNEDIAVQTSEAHSGVFNEKVSKDFYHLSQMSDRMLSAHNKSLRRSIWRRKVRQTHYYPRIMSYKYRILKRPRKLISKDESAKRNFHPCEPALQAPGGSYTDKFSRRHSTRRKHSSERIVKSDKWLLNLLSYLLIFYFS